MPAPSTISEFLDLVRKSGVLDDKKLDAYLEKLRAANTVPARPNELAGYLVRDGFLTHFQAEQFLLGKWRRFTIGKYKVLERLGAGGMGSVYLCEHKLMRRRVAVKVLPTAKADDPSSLERFYREARAVAALDHPNIVRAYDIDQDEKLHFLVMEYVDGASLQEIVKRSGPLDMTRAAHYIRQSALGLQHAHEAAGLVHRDIKPGNILVDRTGMVKVLDMGLARFFHDDEDILTKKYDENVLGTADYLAPEQAVDSHGVDIRADIYSLGATFYFCLTGRTPFSEGTVAQKLIWHQTRQPKSIRTARPDVPEGIVAVVDKMMAKDPAQRYQMPREVAEALAPFAQTPIAPPPEEEMPRLSLAAMGSNAPSDNILPAPGPNIMAAPSPVPRKTWQASATPRPPSNPPPGPTLVTPNTPTASSPRPPRQNTPAPSAPRPQPPPTQAVTPKPVPTVNHNVPTPAPVEPVVAEEENVAWERLAPDTDNLGARADTPSSNKKRPAIGRGPAGRRAEQAARRPWWEIVLVGGFILGGILAAVVAIVVFFFLRPQTDKSNKTESAPQVLFVNRASAAGVFPNLNAARQKVKSGGRIVIQDDAIDEELRLDRAFPKNVTIEGDAGKTVIWRGSRNLDEKDMLVGIDGVEGLHLRNITFDGGGRLQKLILLTGNCPDVVLDNLELRGFQRCAVMVMNCKGEENRPVVFSHLRVTATKEAEAGLLFDVLKSMEIKTNQFLSIQDCRFEGPFKTVIQEKETKGLVQRNVRTSK